MDPLFVAACPLLRENVIFTCTIVSFLCSLDRFLLKNVSVFFFGNQFQNGANLKKKKTKNKAAIFDIFTFLVTAEKTKNTLSHIWLAYIYVFSSVYWIFCLTNFAKKYSFMISLWCEDSWCWFLFVAYFSSQYNKMVRKI